MSGYPSLYGVVNNNYPNYPPNNIAQSVPPSLAISGDNQSCGFPYETSAPSVPFNNNYSASNYGTSQLGGSAHGYPQAPPMMNQPPQQYGNIHH